MASLPVCPSCGSLGVGEHCAQCGATMKSMRAAPAEMLSVAVPGLTLGDGSPQDAPVIEDKRHRQAAAYLSLEPSEMAVLHAASRIFAGYAAAGAVTADNEQEISDRAVRVATRMALVIEKYVQSDGEDW